MVYWGAIGVFRSLGYVAFLAPFLAAWAPNLIFGLTAVYLPLPPQDVSGGRIRRDAG